MKSNSINLRQRFYFKLLALADLLWNDNFKTQDTLDEFNKETITKLAAVIEQLVLLAKRP